MANHLDSQVEKIKFTCLSTDAAVDHIQQYWQGGQTIPENARLAHSGPLPWSSELYNSVSGWLTVLFKPGAMYSSTDPSRMAPFDVLHRLSGYLSPSLYTDLLAFLGTHFETLIQKEQLKQPGKYYEAVFRRQNLSILNRWVNSLNNMLATPYGIEDKDGNLLTFADYVQRQVAFNLAQDQLALMAGGPLNGLTVNDWNEWRKSNQKIIPDLRKANLSAVNLKGANLSGVNLREADLSEANLRETDLSGANLRDANLMGADLSEAKLDLANLRDADLRQAKLSKTSLSRANLSGVNLCGANLS